MPYSYEDEKGQVFKEENQSLFLLIRAEAHKLIDVAGCAKMLKIISGTSGDSWTMLACVDRLVELNEIIEVYYGHCSGQDRIFTKKRD